MKTNPLSRLRLFAWGAWLVTAIAAGAQSNPTPAPRQPDNADAAAATARLRQHGFTDEQASQARACLADAQRQGVPTAALALRLDEGLAKNVDPHVLLAGLQARLRTLVQAHAIVQAANYDMVPNSPNEELLTATGLALESGMPAEDLSAVLQRGKGQSARRMQSIVEAGETLHLAGIDSTTTRNLMNDCLERDLRRMEVLRAVHYTVQQHRGGMDGDNIRRSLWGGKAAVEGAHGWHGGGNGNGHAEAPSGGGTGNRYGGGGSSRPATPGTGNVPATAPMATGNGSGGSGGGSSGNPSGNGNGVGGPP